MQAMPDPLPAVRPVPAAADPGTSVLDSVRRLERRAPWRAFSPVISLASGGLGVVLVVGSQLPMIGAALGSVLAASVSVFAAFVSYRLKQEDDARGEAERHIMERLGVAVALTAEIEDNKEESEAVHSAETIEEVWRKMASDPAFLPFLAEDQGGSQVYSALMDRLVLLPDAVVRPVVRYYAADTTLNESIAAWRNADFRALCNPGDPASVVAGRPRQMRFITWTLLSISDVYDVPLPDPAAVAAMGSHDLAELIGDHVTARQSRGRASTADVDATVEAWIPHADAAIASLRAFATECRDALAFLHRQGSRG